MDRLDSIRTLIAAVDGGSLSAASRSLNVPLPTVSRRVSDLEAFLGTQLVVRTSRKLMLTEIGQSYVEAMRKVYDDLTEAERAASGEYRAPRGELLVTAPIMFGKEHVAPVIHEFLRVYPEVSVRLALFDSVIDIVESKIDVAVRIGQLADSSLVAVRIGEVRWVTCASPEYLERRGTPTTPEELLMHDCIALEGLQHYRDWSFACSRGTISVKIRPRLSVNTADAVIDGAIAGVGIARIISYQAAQGIHDGSLVSILKESMPAPFPVQMVRASNPYQPLKLRAFLDFVAPRLRERLHDVAEYYVQQGDV